MSAKLNIVTINISPEKSDTTALALRDMQSMIDAGWQIVGQSQYQNAVTYTLLFLDGQQTLKIDSKGATGVDARVKVEIPAQSIELGSGPRVH